MKTTITVGFAAALLMSAPAFAAIDASPSATEHKAAPHGSKAEMAENAKEAKATQALNQQATQDAMPDASSAMTPAPMHSAPMTQAPAAGMNMPSGSMPAH
jgi:hypothetical protein